eukprot:GHVL01011385.1.p1 GENE.GHVL01011385.1~~GHVL01011385.1.p1  ORF type:complete len:298 (-),score=57.59 GHVL01011385.1:51-944(-)
MNLLYIIHRYQKIKSMSSEERKKILPRACLMGGKAAPGYFTAKTIIKLANSIAAVINNDPDVSSLLKVVYLPNYNVSSAQIIIPASDISQHISTAGTEASGTSNMKFVMNGGLIIGTFDGANIEIAEECGADTMFTFGALEPDVEKIREKARGGSYHIDGRLRSVFDELKKGRFSLGDGEFHGEVCSIVDRLQNNGSGHNGDFYLVCYDFPSYCDAQDKVDKTYNDPKLWWSLSIKAAASMGKFSTDRSMRDYRDNIWHIKEAARPDPREEESAVNMNEEGTHYSVAPQEKGKSGKK